MPPTSHEDNTAAALPTSWVSQVFRVSESGDVGRSSLIKDFHEKEKALSVVGSDIDPMVLSTNSFNFEEDASADTSSSSTVRGNSICVNNEMEASVDKNEDQLLRSIADDMIGRNVPFESPFGVRAQCYADYTASGKSLESIEQFMRSKVMPTYGNTHTTTSVTGMQTTAFREEARQIIAKAVNARPSKDVVLFAGQGCTSAIHKLISALGINTSKRLRLAYKRPVIFTGPFAHHSNLLPWRESLAADIVEIPEADGGGLDVKELERQLKNYSGRKLKIGTFTAAANLTGLLTDVDEVSKLLHRYDALACWDYATCAPYVEIDMNPKHDNRAYKDAIFFSGHKFVGGPGSPGVLVVKKNVMNNEVPTMPGGGTVLFVTEKAHSYLPDMIEREEGGTPDILGSIRLGLAFALKQRVGLKKIMDQERRHVKRVRESLAVNKNIVLLGRHSDDVDQLPIFSMMVRYGDRFLHHNFVCALLNDLFGVQARGGCQCAGPYGARLLGVNREHTIALGNAVIEKDEAIKPGVVRMSFPYFLDDAEVEYILDAVNFVADNGWKFLPQYDFDIHSAAWRHSSRVKDFFPTKSCLSELQFFSDGTSSSFSVDAPISNIAIHRRENLEQAAILADTCIKEASLADYFPEGEKVLKSHEYLRWFVYPYEALADYKKHGGKAPLTDKISGPCQPHLYLDASINHIWDGTLSESKLKRSRMGRLMLHHYMPSS